MGDVTRNWTGIITEPESLSIEESMNINQLSIAPAGGTATVLGNFPLTVGGEIRQSAPLSIADGQSLTLQSKGPNAPLAGLLITAEGGTVNLIAQF